MVQYVLLVDFIIVLFYIWELKLGKIKKVIILLLVLGVLILLFILVKRYLFAGALTVKVKQGNSTIIIKDVRGKEILRENKSLLSKKISSGVYEVSAISQQGGVSSTKVEVLPRKETKVNLDIKQPSIPALLDDQAASNISSYSGGLYFIQTNSKVLKKIKFNVGSTTSTILNVGPAQKAELNEQVSGYLLTANELIYKQDNKKSTNIRDSILSNIKMLDRPRDIEFSKESKELFVSAGKKLYRSVNGEKAEEIYTAGWSIDAIFYNGDGWVFITELVTENEEEENEDYQELSDGGVSIVLLNIKSGETINLGKTTLTENASWSKSGEFLAYRDDGRVYVYNINEKEQVSKVYLSKNTVFQSTWCPDNSLIFSDSAGVWRHNITDNYKSLVSNLKDVRSLYCDEDDLYVGTFKHPYTGSLYKLSLSSRNNSLISILNSSLPYDGRSVLINYSAFNKKPLVKVRILLPKNLYNKKPGDRGFLSYEIYRSQAEKEAIEYLKRKGINLKDINIEFEIG